MYIKELPKRKLKHAWMDLIQCNLHYVSIDIY